MKWSIVVPVLVVMSAVLHTVLLPELTVRHLKKIKDRPAPSEDKVAEIYWSTVVRYTRVYVKAGFWRSNFMVFSAVIWVPLVALGMGALWLLHQMGEVYFHLESAVYSVRHSRMTPQQRAQRAEQSSIDDAEVLEKASKMRLNPRIMESTDPLIVAHREQTLALESYVLALREKRD